MMIQAYIIGNESTVHVELTMGVLPKVGDRINFGQDRYEVYSIEYHSDELDFYYTGEVKKLEVETHITMRKL